MSKVPISACLIAKNEEKYLEGCLQRLKPYGFEIIVTDTGSTDRTKRLRQNTRTKCLTLNGLMISARQGISARKMHQITGFCLLIVMST